jgi:hypothetical protein
MHAGLEELTTTNKGDEMLLTEETSICYITLLSPEMAS